MPTPTYTPLATVTLASNATSVSFSNIPATYRDLVLIVNGTGTGDENLTPTINGSSSDFSWVQMTSAPGSSSGTNNSIGRFTPDRNIVMIQYFDYAQTDKHKTFLVRTEVSGSEVRQLAARWAQTTAITSVALAIRTGFSFTTGTTFGLYGIRA